MKREMTQLTPRVSRIVASNPSALTGPGTNTYFIGEDDCYILDPGPLMSDHLENIVDAVKGRTVKAVIVTHSHIDHSEAARSLAMTLKVPVLGFGATGAGQSKIMQQIESEGMMAHGEGRHVGFDVDERLQDGQTQTLGDTNLTVHHTPGHFGNHIALELEGDVFSGDLILGWATSIISPPDGDLHQFYSSCEKLRARKPIRLFPGHGEIVEHGVDRIDEIVAHRKLRHSQVLDSLRHCPLTARELVSAIYIDLSPHLLSAAKQNVLAHLIAAWQDGDVAVDLPHWDDGKFSLIS